MKKILLLSMMLSLGFASTTVKANTNIYIFLSFSMPQESIKAWLNEAEKIHASVVIRGLVNNSFKQTIKRLGLLTLDNKGGLKLDPTLFQTYQIKKVPAVVVTNSHHCLSTQTCQQVYDIVYGDVELTYALNKIADRNDSLSPIAATALTVLRGYHGI